MDAWRDDCDDINIQCNEIMSEIQELLRLKRVNADTGKNSAKLRKMFVNLGQSITALEESLKRAYSAHAITEKECTRRQDQVVSFTRQRDNLLNLMQKAMQNGSLDDDRDDLLRKAEVKRQRVWGSEKPQETEQTRLLDNQGVLQYQTTLMQDQDMQVESLRDVVARQKAIATTINNELVDQTKILGDLENKLDNTEGKLKKTGRRMLDVSTQEGKVAMSMCCVCILILILVGILLLVLLL